MREIKFKIWHKLAKEWCGTIRLNQTISHYELDYAPGDLIFLEYTGLKDSNDKEIYEGDILDFKARYKQHGPVEVVFWGGAFGCIVKDECGMQEFWQLNHIVEQYYPKIVGNIFETLIFRNLVIK